MFRGPEPLTVTGTCLGEDCGLAGANDAEAKPAMATNRANMRIADFIFGNLSKFNLERIRPLSQHGSYFYFDNKSSYFISISK
jgi:hypothetical protein